MLRTSRFHEDAIFKMKLTLPWINFLTSLTNVQFSFGHVSLVEKKLRREKFERLFIYTHKMKSFTLKSNVRH